MTIGILGLGKMGSRIARKLSAEHTVLAWNRTPQPGTFPSIELLAKNLPKPRIFWIMVPSGVATEEVFGQLMNFAQSGDIVIDAGNSNFKDSERRSAIAAKKGIKFLGVGVSGGIIGETAGYPIMAGGDKNAYDAVVPIFESLAKPGGGYAYFGPGGAGHFVKMIHNGTEYGIMQSLGEGFGVLAKAPYKLDLLAIAKLWQKGTLLSGFMLDRVVDVLAENPTLDNVVGNIAQSGDAVGTIAQAKAEEVPVEIIERSLDYRIRSQTDPVIQQSFTAKLVASLRNAFGGHEVKKK